MIQKTFELGIKSKILLYGAAYQGTVFYKRIKQAGGTVVGFIDKRAKEIKMLEEVPVYTLEEVVLHFQSNEVVVIISVKNVFEHSQIAAQVAKAGLEHIIYKPELSLKGYGIKELDLLSSIYDKILETGRLDSICLCSTSPKFEPCYSERYLVNETKQDMTVIVPLILLFQDRNIQQNGVDLNTVYLYPHIQFFQYLEGKRGADYKLYLSYCEMAAEQMGSFEITDAWRENVIRNRADVYGEMHNSFRTEPAFFFRNAPKAEWNNKGYFNLKSGKHRAAFYAANHMMYIPLKISRNDCETWLQQEVAREVFEYFVENDIYDLNAPIEHPFFYEYPCSGRVFYENLVFLSAEVLSQRWYDVSNMSFMESRKIYVNLNDYGWTGRYFKRMGCQVYDGNNKEIVIKDMLDEMFCLKQKYFIYTDEKVDAVIAEIQSEEEAMQMMDEIPAECYFFITKECLKIDSGLQISGGICRGQSSVLLFWEKENV